MLLSNLSVWAFQTQRPAAIREVHIEDKKHGARWQVRPQAQSPIELTDLNASFGVENQIGSLLAVFREGMSSNQVAYRLLCYFKILDAWKHGQGPFSQTNQLLKNAGQFRNMGQLKIHEDMFRGKCREEAYSDYLGKKFSWCIDQFSDARHFIAHPFRESGEFISLDHPQTLIMLSDLANITERMVIDVLVEELGILATLNPSATSLRVLRSLTHTSWDQGLSQLDSL